MFPKYIKGSLRNDDGDVNENGKKAIGLDWQNNNFARASRFFCTFLHDYHVKMPIFTFCVGLERKNTTFFSFSGLRYQLQKELPTVFDKLKEME